MIVNSVWSWNPQWHNINGSLGACLHDGLPTPNVFITHAGLPHMDTFLRDRLVSRFLTHTQTHLYTHSKVKLTGFFFGLSINIRRKS